MQSAGDPGHSPVTVADLEKHAIKRDKRFILRLFLLLAIAALGGLFIYGKMTSDEFANCAAGSFGAATGEDGDPAPGAAGAASE